MGECAADGVTLSINDNVIDISTALTGAGILQSFSGGTTGEASLTLLEFDKHILKDVLGAVKGWNTSASDGAAGGITGGYSPGVIIQSKPLFIYPTFIDPGTNEPFAADITNKYAFGFVWATPNAENEMMVSPSEATSFPITFKAQYDNTRPEGQKLFFMGAVSAPAASVMIITSI